MSWGYKCSCQWIKKTTKPTNLSHTLRRAWMCLALNTVYQLLSTEKVWIWLNGCVRTPQKAPMAAAFVELHHLSWWWWLKYTHTQTDWHSNRVSWQCWSRASIHTNESPSSGRTCHILMPLLCDRDGTLISCMVALLAFGRRVRRWLFVRSSSEVNRWGLLCVIWVGFDMVHTHVQGVKT